MELSKTEGKRILRSLGNSDYSFHYNVHNILIIRVQWLINSNFPSELKAYRSVVDALRAQGTLTKNKHEVLKNLAAALKVDEERSRSEIRRAVNNNLLTSVAQWYAQMFRVENRLYNPRNFTRIPELVFTFIGEILFHVPIFHIMF